MKIFLAALLSVPLAAQLPPLPAQSFYSVGKTDWAVPCGDYGPNTYMTTQPWNRTVDPSYPGTTQRWSINTGGILFLRAEQHLHCPGYMGIGQGLAPYFLFGPRTGVIIPMAHIPGFQTIQSTVFNAHPLMVLYYPSYQGPNEFNPALETWAYSITVPNNPALAGQEWACQALALTAATMTFNLSGSYYTKII
jgi:hypothetical protein